MTHKILVTVVLAGILIVLVGCGQQPTAEPTIPSAGVALKVSGSGTVVPILSAIKAAFEADVVGYRLEILPGTGTGGGVQGVTEGILDVAAMSRPPKDEETAQGIKYVEFGRSGVAVLVHPGVGVTSLTEAQITAIFSGEVANWSEVGGPDLELILYVRDEGDSSTKALRQAILGDTAFPDTVTVLTSQADMQAAVAGTPGGVGFGSWSSALAAGADVRAPALDGVALSDSNYPIYTPVGIGYLADREADVQPLIDWLLSEQGQAALREFDMLPIR